MDPRLMVTLVLDYDLQVRDAYSHLFGGDGSIVWSYFNHGRLESNPHDQLLTEMARGDEAMGRYYTGELSVVPD